MKLVTLTEDDREQVNKWMDTPSIFYYLCTEPLNEVLPIYSFGIWLSGELIGWANLQNIDMDNKKAEFGIALPGRRPSGIAIKATIKVLKFAFQTLKLNRVYIRPLKSNVRYKNDQRDRFGFVREGVERQAVKRGNEYEDVIVMSILKDEFERRWM